jgi:hypothetical protein
VDSLEVSEAYILVHTQSYSTQTPDTMLSKLLPTLFLFTACIAQETCPQLPDTGVEIGQPVPIKPEDIPRGCSNFEILVGSTHPPIFHPDSIADGPYSSGNE